MSNDTQMQVCTGLAIIKNETGKCGCPLKGWSPYSLYLNEDDCQFPAEPVIWKLVFVYIFAVGYGVGLVWASVKLFFLFKNISRSPLMLSHVITFCWIVSYASFFTNTVLLLCQLPQEKLY